MKKTPNARSIKHTVRLNPEEEKIFQANLKKSGLDASAFMRKLITIPWGDMSSDDDIKVEASKLANSKFFMSPEQIKAQEKGIGGILMALFVIHQLFKKGKKK